MAESKDQRHPQYTKDRQILNELLTQTVPSNRGCADLARLLVRYRDFVGARDIQADLVKALNNWQFTEETLFAKTREIHAIGEVYEDLFTKIREIYAMGKVYMDKEEEQDDWS